MRICSDCRVEKDLEDFAKWSRDKKHGRKYVCKSCDNMRSKIYRQNNVEKERIRRKNKYIKYRDKEIARDNAYKKRRCETDPSFKMLRRLRDRHGKAIKNAGVLKSFRTTDLLGCDAKTLKLHFESLFKPDMNWSNYGSLWNIDHIFPLSKVDWSNEDQVNNVCNYKNLMPQYKEINYKKGSKLNFYQ